MFGGVLAILTNQFGCLFLRNNNKDRGLLWSVRSIDLIGASSLPFFLFPSHHPKIPISVPRSGYSSAILSPTLLPRGTSLVHVFFSFEADFLHSILGIFGLEMT